MKIQEVVIILLSLFISSCGGVKYSLNPEATKFFYGENLDIGIASASAISKRLHSKLE